MFWKKKETTGKDLIRINELLKLSFANVKRDTTNIFKWLDYLYRKNLQQEQLIRQMQMELSYMPKTREEIRKIIDDFYSFESILSKISQLNVKIDELAKMRERDSRQLQPHQTIEIKKEPREVEIGIADIEKRLERLEQKRTSFKEKLVRKITRNSKDYVKSVILSYIKKYERVSALQLKEIVVDEQNFCSKSSFYRLLEEIEQLEGIGVVKERKEKHYFYKNLAKTKAI